MSLKVHELKPILEPLSFKKIYTEFLGEAELFADMVSDFDISTIASDFNDFTRYLTKSTRSITGNRMAASLSSGSNILLAANATGKLKTILTYSQVATCCEMFNGWSMTFTENMKQDFARELEQKLHFLKSADEAALNNMYLRIATADTVRILMILKMLGLLRADTSKKRILSFGAASGVKELYATHTEPRLTQTQLVRNSNGYQLVFSSTLKWPKQTVLIDYDTHWQAHYDNITATHAANVLGLLGDFEQIIQDLPTTLHKHDMDPADFIIGWRIDHQIIPDIPRFFKSLAPSLANNSKLDLVITIGAGDDDDDFAGRVRTMDGIWDYLKSCGLAPVRILLHDGGRDYPLLGYGGYATYEVIYCSVDKKKLK